MQLDKHLLAPDFAAQSVQLKREVPQVGNLEVEINGNLMEQAMIHLLKNALEACMIKPGSLVE